MVLVILVALRAEVTVLEMFAGRDEELMMGAPVVTEALDETATLDETCPMIEPVEAEDAMEEAATDGTADATAELLACLLTRGEASTYDAPTASATIVRPRML